MGSDRSAAPGSKNETWTTCPFQRWRKSGVWDKMFAELQTALDVESNVDWEIHFIDSTTVRAHQHAAGAKKALPNERH
jgi:transposase